MDAGKLINRYIDTIEKAYKKNIPPEQLDKFIENIIPKTPADLERKMMIGLMAYIHNNKYKSLRRSIIIFIKSKDFKMMIPKSVAKEKNFFEKNSPTYQTKGSKTLRMDLTFSEHKRYKFVEDIFGKKYKNIEKFLKALDSISPALNTGISRLLLKVSKARRN